MEESDLRTMSLWQLDEDRVERFDVPFGEIFEKATESDKIISLSSRSEAVAALIFDTV